MELSLTEASHLLGKTPRQVRYLIKLGKLSARKDRGRWVVQSEDLPLSEGQLRARSRKVHELRDAVDEALGAAGRVADRRFSVRDLRAFVHGADAWRRLVGTLGPEHPATAALEEALVAMTRGCHRFHDRDKRQAYAEAREHAARATALALLSGHEGAGASGSRTHRRSARPCPLRCPPSTGSPPTASRFSSGPGPTWRRCGSLPSARSSRPSRNLRSPDRRPGGNSAARFLVDSRPPGEPGACRPCTSS